MLVHRCGNHLRAIETEALDRGQESRPFHDDLVPSPSMVLPSRSSACWLPVVTTRRSGATSGTPLPAMKADNCRAAADSPRSHRIAKQHPPPAAGQRQRLRRCRLRQTWRCPESPRKADDSGLAQQLEEFADRRGFYVIESFGKLHTFLVKALQESRRCLSGRLPLWRANRPRDRKWLLCRRYSMQQVIKLLPIY